MFDHENIDAMHVYICIEKQLYIYSWCLKTYISREISKRNV